MGVYWVETGSGLRPSEVIYDRAGSSFAISPHDAWDWPAVLDGADHLHVSGINVALGRNTTMLVMRAVEAANAASIPVSFDGNFRARLWADRDSVDALSLLKLASSADVLFCDHRDISLLLGRTFHGETSDSRRKAAQAAFDTFPKLKLMASTIRRTPHVGEHALSARVDTADGSVETDPVLIPNVIDRVGSGDAFAAGILHGYRHDLSAESIARTGLALGALKHSLQGDASRITAAHLSSFMGGTFDVRR